MEPVKLVDHPGYRPPGEALKHDVILYLSWREFLDEPDHQKLNSLELSSRIDANECAPLANT